MNARRRSGGRPTLEDVAAHVGVSRATVSRVVNGSPRVSDQMRGVVVGAIEQLGYVPNRAARALATLRTGTVAAVLATPDGHDGGLTRALRSGARVLSAHDMHMVLLVADGADDVHRITRVLESGHVDAALVHAPRRDDPLLDVLGAVDLPIACVGRPWAPISNAYVVDYDRADGARAATERLRARGCRAVGFLGGPADLRHCADELVGWRQVVGEGAGPAGHAELGVRSIRDAERATTALLDREPALDGLLTSSDLLAAGAIRALHRLGRRVPDDVAVLGLTVDGDLAEFLEPPLTTMSIDTGTCAGEAASALIAVIRGEQDPAGQRLLPMELTVRRSG